MILKYNIDNNIGGKNYEKEYFCIRNYPNDNALAVGCSNNASQSNINNEAKSTKTSHKKSHKAKKHTTKKDKTEIDTDNSETTNSDKKTDKSSENSKSSTSEKTSQNGSASSNSNESENSNNSNGSSNSSASNTQNNSGQSAASANNSSDTMFNKMVSNTIKENGYSSSYGPDNFTLIDGGNGQYSLAEKSTGTIVGHYSVKNGDLYKQDVITGNDVKVK